MISRPMNRRPLRPALMVVFAVLTSLALGACGQPDASLGTPEPQAAADPSGRILFVADEEVRLWDGDVSQVTDVDDELEALSPSWAPDGERFAYVQADRGKGYSDLFIANLDGETIKQVTFNAPD